MGFYSRLTPFQQGLVSVLMVAIPYFIAMVIIYVYFGLFASGSERCESLCCYHRMKLIESRMNSTQPPDFVKFTGHPEDYDFENDEVNTKSTENSIVPVTLPSVDDSLKWTGYVLKGSRKNRSGGDDYLCPGALLNTSEISLVMTAQGCGGKADDTWFKIGNKDVQQKDMRSVSRMFFFKVEDISSELKPEDKWNPIGDDEIRFIGWNSTSKKIGKTQFRFNNTVGCPKSGISYSPNNYKDESCLVVDVEENTFSVIKNAIMVGPNAQLLGTFEESNCKKNSCLVFYEDSTRYKKAISDKIKDLLQHS